NAGDPTKWTYVADQSRPAENTTAGSINPTFRLTAQVSPKHKLNLYWDPSSIRLSDRPQIGGITGPTAGAPETGTTAGGTGYKGNYSRMETARWTSTITARLLLEAGGAPDQQNSNGPGRPGKDPNPIPVTRDGRPG